MIGKYLTDPETTDLIELTDILLDESNQDRHEIMYDIGNNDLVEFTNVIYEVLMTDNDPSIRATAFWVLALLSDERGAQRLVEALEEEEDQNVKLSMIDTLRSYIMTHDVQISGIEEIETEQPSTVVEKVVVDDFYKEHDSIDTKINQIAEARTRLKQILLDLSPNIPISLSRLADLSGVTEKSLDRFLREMNNASAGKYYPMEQVFIKELRTDAQILTPEKRREPTCIDCGAISVKYPCVKCGEGMQCMVCKLMIGDDDNRAECDNCHTPAHLKHLQEWARIKSDCPYCKEKLSII